MWRELGSHEDVGFVQDGSGASVDPVRMTTRVTADFEALSDRLRGRLVRPGEPDWDVARRAWNLAVDQRPAAVVEALGPDDVQAVVAFAAGAGLRVAPQSTGHGSEALGPLAEAILLKTTPMRGITVDPAAGIARIEAGVIAGEVAVAAGEHRLAPVLGLAPTVGVAGLTLGGGTGWLSRSYGLAANNVRALEVVTAAGAHERIDAHDEPELFWALRGGGGRFAIVTALELDAHPVPEVSAGSLFWPAEHAAEILERFRRWTVDVPESLGAVFRYLSMPPIDEVPAPLRGRKVVAIIAAHLGTEPDGRRIMEPLRGSRTTLIDTFGPVGAADLVRIAGDPERPGPARGAGFLVKELRPDLVHALAELIAEDALAPLGVLEVRLLGGALSRGSEGAGALASLDGKFSIFAGGPAFDADTRAAIDDRLEGLHDRLEPWRSSQALLNSARFGTDPARAFGEETWARLGRVRDTYDPDRLILSSHEIPPS
jgi:FAD/FMN-containing dehydrogenase